MVTKAIALPNDNNAPGTSSGTRADLDMDFDFLNQVQQNDRTRLAEQRTDQINQENELGDLLTSLNSNLSSEKGRKRDFTILNTSQANELAAKSDQIRQNAMDAAADPFNELKALFSDTKSAAEWAASHNAVQNELKTVQRRHTSQVAGYNFNLGEMSKDVRFAQQKMKLTEGNIANIGRFNSAFTTSVVAMSNAFTQQLNTMGTRDQLQAEFDDKSGTIPKDLVRRRIADIDTAKAQLATARAGAGKSLAEKKRIEFDIITKYGHLLSESTIAQALEGGKSVYEPHTGILITEQIAKVVRTAQLKNQDERAVSISGLVTNQQQGKVALSNAAGMLQRLAGPGNSAFARDENGMVTGLDPSRLTAATRMLGTQLFETAKASEDITNRIMSGEITGNEQIQDALALQGVLNSQTLAMEKQLQETAKKDAAEAYENKEAKVSAGQFVVTGEIKNEAGASGILIEGATSVQSGLPATFSQHGTGWGKGYELYSATYNAEHEGIVGGDDLDLDLSNPRNQGESAIASLLATKASSKDAAAVANRRALQKSAGGKNIMAAGILNDFYEVAVVRAIRVLMDRHAAEPETRATLNRFILGDTALSPAITGVKDADGKDIEANLVLYAKVQMAEEEMRKSGTLSENSTLSFELHSILLGDKIEGDMTLYDMPEIRSMVAPSTAEGGAMNRMLFKNNAMKVFKDGLQQISKSIPIDRIGSASALVEQERITQAVLDANPLQSGPGIRQNAESANSMKKLAAMQKEMGESGATVSFTDVIRKLTEENER